MIDPAEFGQQIGGLIREALAPVHLRLQELGARELKEGAPGKDADPAVIARMVDEAVRAIPPARDGADAAPVTDEQIAAQVVRHLSENPPAAGRDADPAQIAAMVKEAVDAMPLPRDGKDAEPVSDERLVAAVARHLQDNPVPAGKDAPPVELEALADLVVDKLLGSARLETLLDLATTAAVAKHFEANPVRHGRDADPAAIEAAVRAAVAELPKPKDGRDAEPVTEQAIAAQVAKHLVENPPQAGADGVGLAGAMIDRAGELVITTTKGDAVRLGKVVGEDGRDGLSFESASGEYDAERGFVISLGAGERRTELVLPYMVHRGFWREGLGTKAGQSITHDGALWIAKRDNASKPCLENQQDWALAARKGRDGKDGKSVRVPPGPVQLGDSHA